MKRKKGAGNEPGATWARDTVWMASASRSLGKRKRVQLSAKSWSNDGPLKRRRGTQSQPSHRKESIITRMSVLSQEGGVTVLSQEGEYFTYVQACLYGGRPEILFPVRFIFLRSLRVVSILSDLMVMARSAEGGCETSGGICPLTDPLELTLFPVSDLCR